MAPDKQPPPMRIAWFVWGLGAFFYLLGFFHPVVTFLPGCIVTYRFVKLKHPVKFYLLYLRPEFLFHAVRVTVEVSCRKIAYLRLSQMMYRPERPYRRRQLTIVAAQYAVCFSSFFFFAETAEPHPLMTRIRRCKYHGGFTQVNNFTDYPACSYG